MRRDQIFKIITEFQTSIRCHAFDEDILNTVPVNCFGVFLNAYLKIEKIFDEFRLEYNYSNTLKICSWGIVNPEHRDDRRST